MEAIIVENVKKYFQLPKPLYEKADELCSNLGLNFSELLRKALESFITNLEKERINKEIAEACKYFYEIDKDIAAEWRAAEGHV